jgi:hypothetical protein
MQADWCCDGYIVEIRDESGGKFLDPYAVDGLSNTPYSFETEEQARRALGWSPYRGRIYKMTTVHEDAS